MLLRLDFRRTRRCSEESLIELTQRVRWWGKVLETRGVAALLETATADARIPERLLSLRGGERMLTDLRHLGQSLHAAMTSSQLGVGALVEWLRARISDAHDVGISDGTRRLETDAKAVTILTVHRSKGLEFPIVYLPKPVSVSNGSDECRILSCRADGDQQRECARGRRSPVQQPGAFLRYRTKRTERHAALYVARLGSKPGGTWWPPSSYAARAATLCFSRPTDPRHLKPPSWNGDPFGNRELVPDQRETMLRAN